MALGAPSAKKDEQKQKSSIGYLQGKMIGLKYFNKHASANCFSNPFHESVILPIQKKFKGIEAAIAAASTAAASAKGSEQKKVYFVPQADLLQGELDFLNECLRDIFNSKIKGADANYKGSSAQIDDDRNLNTLCDKLHDRCEEIDKIKPNPFPILDSPATGAGARHAKHQQGAGGAAAAAAAAASAAAPPRASSAVTAPVPKK